MQYSNPYPKNLKVEEFLRSIDWSRLEALDTPTLVEKVWKIAEIASHCPPKSMSFASAVLHNLKKLVTGRPDDLDSRMPTHLHILSDHSLCRILELIGKVDIMKLKNEAYDALLKSRDYEPVFSRNVDKIVTIRRRKSKILS